MSSQSLEGRPHASPSRVRTEFRVCKARPQRPNNRHISPQHEATAIIANILELIMACRFRELVPPPAKLKVELKFSQSSTYKLGLAEDALYLYLRLWLRGLD